MRDIDFADFQEGFFEYRNHYLFENINNIPNTEEYSMIKDVLDRAEALLSICLARDVISFGLENDDLLSRFKSGEGAAYSPNYPMGDRVTTTYLMKEEYWRTQFLESPADSDSLIWMIRFAAQALVKVSAAVQSRLAIGVYEAIDSLSFAEAIDIRWKVSRRHRIAIEEKLAKDAKKLADYADLKEKLTKAQEARDAEVRRAKEAARTNGKKGGMTLAQRRKPLKDWAVNQAKGMTGTAAKRARALMRTVPQSLTGDLEDPERVMREAILSAEKMRLAG